MQVCEGHYIINIHFNQLSMTSHNVWRYYFSNKWVTAFIINLSEKISATDKQGICLHILQARIWLMRMKWKGVTMIA